MLYCVWLSLFCSAPLSPCSTLSGNVGDKNDATFVFFYPNYTSTTADLVAAFTVSCLDGHEEYGKKKSKKKIWPWA